MGGSQCSVLDAFFFFFTASVDLFAAAVGVIVDVVVMKFCTVITQRKLQRFKRFCNTVLYLYNHDAGHF